MKNLYVALWCCLLVFKLEAAEPVVLSEAQLRAKVAEVTQAQNQVMLKGSDQTDVDVLFALYSDDFIYQHDVYGGQYSKEQLYANTMRLLAMGKYDKTEPRYQILNQIPGYNAVAVERQEVHNGVVQRHLAVFEFRGDKVSKIVEYWK